MPEFLIWSEEHGRWWKASRWGYTSQIREAGRYSEGEAASIVNSANYGGRFHEIAIPVPEGMPSVTG